MNIGGLLVVALGLLIVIIALRGTQNVVFPGLFPTPSSSSSSSPTPVNGKCPSGYILFNGKCVQESM